MRRLVTILAVVALAAATAWAAPGAGPGPGPGPGPGGGPRHGMGPQGFGPGAPFHEELFPPDLVLSNQAALGLTADQLATIKGALKETQAKGLDIQVEIQRVQEKLRGILAPAKVDATAALAAADEAMTFEAQMKRAHLSMLIRVKNALTEEQIAKLREMRPPRSPAPSSPQE